VCFYIESVIVKTINFYFQLQTTQHLVKMMWIYIFNLFELITFAE